mgnify:CR=1 FL=1
MKISLKYGSIGSGGFTLIELLVVISIISLLSSIVLTSVNSARAKARDVRRRADMKQVQTALEFYFDANNTYPPSTCGDGCGGSFSGLTAPLAPYLAQIPTDPKGDAWHAYLYVRGPADAYGFFLRMESTGYCKMGVNVNPGWWGVSVPLCP